MKTRFRWLLVPAIVLLPAIAWAQTPGSGIQGTAHDWAGIGTPATGLCTFCHTPHKANTTQLLWNHTASLNPNFSWTDAATTAGTNFPSFPSDTYRGNTVRCLSCHDGSVAIGDIGWWNGGVPPTPLLNSMVGSDFQVGTGGSMDGNHPVAMPFPWNGVGSTYNGVTTGTFDAAEWDAQPELAGIRLFSDDGSGNITPGPVSGATGMECSSCHDPHNGSEVQDVFFLRGLIGGNTSDYICSKCHNK